MSVFGIDLGTQYSVVSVTRHGGVDVILNEVSKRETAVVTSFATEERFIGEGGLDRAVRNINNTVSNVKRFIGLRMDDPQLAIEKQYNFCNLVGDADNKVMFEVEYNGEQKTFYPEQVLAMFLGQLRGYVQSASPKDEAKDCVVSVPAWFTVEQRQLVLQAAEIAGLNCMSLINESTSAALDFGIFRGTDLPQTQDTALAVALVDIGYAATTVTVNHFWKGHMKVLSRVYDKNLGTRDIDLLLSQKCAADIKTKYRIEVMENKRARLRLLQGCDKVKIMLSANLVAPLNIENLMDCDVNMMVQREDLEALIAPLVERLKGLCATAIQQAGVPSEKIFSVEMIGGGCRIPSFKSAVGASFPHSALSFTLAATETIAKGAAITAAVFSPLFQVREFVVNESPLTPILVGYHSETAQALSNVSFLPQVNKVLPILKEADRYPKTLELTFERRDAFDLWAFYDENLPQVKEICPAGNLIVGHWTIGAASKPTNGNVIVRVKFHANGLVYLDGASTMEEYEVEEKIPVPAAPAPAPAPAAGDAAAPPAEPPKPAEPQFNIVKKTKTRRIELAVNAKGDLLGQPSARVQEFTTQEREMRTRDLLIRRTKEARNELESYVYDFRSQISSGGQLNSFTAPENVTKFVEMANSFETWLYEDGQDAKLGEYASRLEQLKAIGNPAQNRYRLHDQVTFAEKDIPVKVAALAATLDAKRGKEAHITDEDIDGGKAKCDGLLKWFQESFAAYKAADRHVDPTLTPVAIDAKLKELDGAVKAIVNKKPPPPPPKPATPAAETKPADSAAPPPPPPAPEGGSSPKGPERPVDLD